MTVFRKILCVADHDEGFSEVLERAVELAENNQSSLTLIDLPGRRQGDSVQSEQPALLAAHMALLEDLVEPFRAKIDIETKVVNGIRFLGIVRTVLDGEHDLVIKTPEAHAWLDRLFGSEDMNLLRVCPCPVWLVKRPVEKVHRRLLAAVDVDDNYPPEELSTRRALNLSVLETAASLAVSEFAQLDVVCAWQAPGESSLDGAFVRTPQAEILEYVEQSRSTHEANLTALMSEFSKTIGEDRIQHLSPKTHLVKGLARTQIPAMAEKLSSDLVVMGTVARTGVPGFLMGNTAESILNQIECSVLAIKPPGFETPVTLGD